MIEAKNIAKFNSTTQAWANLTKKKLWAKLAGYGLSSAIYANGRKSLMKSLVSGIGRKDGMVEVVKFKFALHGSFYDRGVGRGQKMGEAGKRSPHPWLYIIDEESEKLFNEIAEQFGNEAAEQVKVIGK